MVRCINFALMEIEQPESDAVTVSYKSFMNSYALHSTLIQLSNTSNSHSTWHLKAAKQPEMILDAPDSRSVRTILEMNRIG